jgi:hypothetical protein
MKILILFVAVALSGCVAPLEMYAHYLNTQDPCQRQNNGGNYPSFCGAGAGKTYIYNNTGQQVGYTKSRK